MFFKRQKRRGSALIEVMISIVVMALIALMTANVIGQNLKRQADRTDRYWLSEFARSVALEYKETYPHMAMSGMAEGGWYWDIQERQANGMIDSIPDIPIEHIELTINAWSEKHPENIFTVTSWMAIRRQ